jgi:hypothetical protein
MQNSCATMVCDSASAVVEMACVVATAVQGRNEHEMDSG